MDHLSHGRHLYFELHGPRSGSMVVLLHHGLGSVRAWKAQIPVLVEVGFHVLAYDRWGYGGSEARPRLSIPTFEDDLADLLSLVDALKLPKFSLVGHSDGGTISLYFAAVHPEHLYRLVSVAAHIYIELKMEMGIQGVCRAFQSDPAFREGLQHAHADKTQAVFSAWFEGWHDPANLSWDMRPVLGKITCPALIVQGMRDEHATPQHAFDAATAIPNSEPWPARGAAHMLPQEMPEVFNRRMLYFLL